MNAFLETERLILRKFSPGDLEDLFRLESDPDVMKYFAGGDSYEAVRERLEKIIAYYSERPGLGYFAIIPRQQDIFIGTAGIRCIDDADEIQFGFKFFKEYWGKGYATEVARALVRYGFEVQNLPRMAAVVHPENLASCRVLEKCGLRFEKLSSYRDMPVAYYSLDRESFADRGYGGSETR